MHRCFNEQNGDHLHCSQGEAPPGHPTDSSLRSAPSLNRDTRLTWPMTSDVNGGRTVIRFGARNLNCVERVPERTRGIGLASQDNTGPTGKELSDVSVQTQCARRSACSETVPRRPGFYSSLKSGQRALPRKAYTKSALGMAGYNAKLGRQCEWAPRSVLDQPRFYEYHHSAPRLIDDSVHFLSVCEERNASKQGKQSRGPTVRFMGHQIATVTECRVIRLRSSSRLRP